MMHAKRRGRTVVLYMWLDPNRLGLTMSDYSETMLLIKSEKSI